ncbi:hypothetical protein [Chryseolinea lacunae]|uniref:DUF4304 domain-containing protein n=1 Tax=Chryseolinea lacunae TaxID=2801331 RepID=A0ABS1KKB5_9BACT|nr:hypothetical protein [Chryseolinea lacunae]MBL0739693.1 hypothetical protein [Chryseolinea lacunae]
MKGNDRHSLQMKNNYFLEKIRLLLKPMGFRYHRKGNTVLFHRGTLYGYNQVYISQQVEENVLSITPFFYTRINSINIFANPFLGCPETLFNCNPTIGANLCNLGLENDILSVRTTDDVENALFIFEGIMETNALPFFETLCCSAAIDLELNRDARPKNLYLNDIIERPIVGTVAAMLNRNERFSTLVKYYREMLSDTSTKIEMNYESLLESLKIYCA